MIVEPITSATCQGCLKFMRVMRSRVLKPRPHPAAFTCADDLREVVPTASRLTVCSRLNFAPSKASRSTHIKGALQVDPDYYLLKTLTR